MDIENNEVGFLLKEGDIFEIHILKLEEYKHMVMIEGEVQ